MSAPPSPGSALDATQPEVVWVVPDKLECWDAVEALVASLPDPAACTSGSLISVRFASRPSGWFSRLGFGKRPNEIEAAVACTALLRRGFADIRVDAARGVAEARVPGRSVLLDREHP